VGEPRLASGSGEADEIARLTDERDRLRAEVGELRAQVAVAGAAPRRARRPRRVVAAALVVLTSIVFTVAVAGVWARRNALDTDRWVETVGPIGEDPAVQQALGNWITTELMGVIDPQALFESALPERGQVLAAPLTSALRGFVGDQVDAFLASDTFERLWVQANERAHAAAVRVLEGDVDGRGGNAGSLQVEDGEVVINLVPALNQVLARIGEVSPEILGRTVDIPTVTVDDIPQEAVDKVEDALGRDIPDDFGQFTVFDAQRLDQVQDAVSLFDRLVVAAAVLAVVLIGLTLWVSPRRRRTLLQLAVGIALGVVLVRRLTLRLEDDVVDLARPENQDAVEVVIGAFVSSLLDATAWILVIAAVVAAVALVTGPYRWVVAVRRRTVSLARALAGAVSATAARRPDEPAVAWVAWVAGHRDALQAGGIIAGILVLLVADLSWLGLVVLALLVAAFELALHRIGDVTPERSRLDNTPADPGIGVGGDA
jgi:ribosomal protein L29